MAPPRWSVETQSYGFAERLRREYKHLGTYPSTEAQPDHPQHRVDRPAEVCTTAVSFEFGRNYPHCGSARERERGGRWKICTVAAHVVEEQAVAGSA